MFFLLAACLGQSFLTSPAFTLLPLTRVAATEQTTAPTQPDQRAPAPAAPKKHTSTQASGSVQAIQLNPCDKMGDYDIPAQRFDETMQQIAHATGCGINPVGGSSSPATAARLSAMPVGAVRGHLTVRQACLMALRGSSFEYVEEKDNILYVRLRK